MSASAERTPAVPPVVVIDDEPRVLTAARAVAEQARRFVLCGWRLPASPWDLSSHAVVVSGSLREGALEEDLLDAVVRGAGAIVAIDEEDRPARLLDALRRIASVTDGRQCKVLRLDERQIALLAALARGACVQTAARSTFMSVRTAHRRIAEARAVLDAGSTNETVAAVREALRFWEP